MKRRFREEKLLRRRERNAAKKRVVDFITSVCNEDLLNQAIAEYKEKDEQGRIVKQVEDATA